MVRETLTGSRIRERRIMAAMRQTDLAQALGISASYLNLIEHNRRRIGGKLLVSIANALNVEPSLLTEGAAKTLVAAVGEAAASVDTDAAETDQSEEFARRFPGWAEVISNQHRRIVTLERTVEALTDRLAHDPQLATSLHEVLSTAAAVRSVASILAEPGDLEPVWRDRFTKNLNDDSLRLAESSKALVAYLDANETGSDRRALPREEAEAVLAANNYVVEALETPGAVVADARDTLVEAPGGATRKILASMLQQYLADAVALPRADLLRKIEACGGDALAIAQATRLPLPVVMRRLAVMRDEDLAEPYGLVICDAAGSILFQKALGSFSVPRAVPPCPLWPLFLALHRPQVPVLQRLTQVGRGPAHYTCLAVAETEAGTVYDAQPRIQSTMLLQIAATDQEAPQSPLEVGSSCRVCSRVGCSARREPSLLSV